MKISEIMTKEPAASHPDTGIEEIARHMVTCDCGSVPIVEGGRVVGIITDRDIVVRAIAAGRSVRDLCAKDLMSHPVAVLSQDDDLEKAVKFLEQNQVRRAPIVDNLNRMVGIVSQADLARGGSTTQIGSLVQSISATMDIGHE